MSDNQDPLVPNKRQAEGSVPPPPAVGGRTNSSDSTNVQSTPTFSQSVTEELAQSNSVASSVSDATPSFNNTSAHTDVLGDLNAPTATPGMAQTKPFGSEQLSNAPAGQPAQDTNTGNTAQLPQQGELVSAGAATNYGVASSNGFGAGVAPIANSAGGSGGYSDGSGGPTGQDDKPASGKPRHKLVVPLVSALIVGGLLGGGAGAGVSVWAQNQNSGTKVTSSDSTQSIVNNTSSVTSVTAAVVKASPSAVTISAETTSGESGTGSGVVLSKDGYILTNAHVATLDGATSSATLTVTTSSNQVLKAKLVGYDANSDLAVLKVSATNLTPATFADSSKLNVGDSVVAIGAPLGLSNTVTDGIISTLHRGITVQSSAVEDSQSNGDSNQSDSSDPFQFWGYGNDSNSQQSTTTSSVYLSVIQTDAAINPGNSGGPLVNSSGEVVGINVAIATASSSSSSSSSSSGSIGVGFAIPSSFAKRIAQEIIDSGKASHGLLGATIADSTTSSSYAGGVIKSVVSNGAAAKAGIKSGDVITAVDGVSISNATDLTAIVRQYAANTKVTLTYARDGKLYKTQATLGTLSESSN